MGENFNISDDVISDEAKAVASGQHVLVADDSSVARNQVKRVLDYLGVESTLVNNGQEAYDQLKAWVAEGKDLQKWLALIISDVEMPMMDGYSLTTKIRKDPDLKNVYVILHTSLSGVFNNAMVERVGANKFIPKYDPDELTKVISERLNEHAAEIS